MRALYRDDLKGMVFGDWEVLDFSHKDGAQTMWLCRCSCGNEKPVVSSSLKNGKSTSCGHWKSNFLKDRAKHNQHGTKLYRVWGQMIQRCTNPNHDSYHNYGGRGITVCDDWKDFEIFALEMGEDWKEGLTLDRKDNDKGYSKENCEWVTRSEQLKNRRPRSEWKNSGKRPAQLIVQTPKGEMPLRRAAEVYGVHWATITHRLARGWDPIEAVTTPAVRGRPRVKDSP